MNDFKKCFSIVALGLVLVAGSIAQNRVRFGGVHNAWDYAYGSNPAVPPLRAVFAVAAGTNSMTVEFGSIPLPDGTMLTPLATNAPIVVGSGAAAETVTPLTVSCASPTVNASCSFTAVFANAHFTGELISSATFGLQEAADAAHVLGGLVIIEGRWKQAGGVAGTLTGNTGWTNVSVLDGRGTVSGSAFSYKAASNGAAWAASAISWY